MCLLLAFTQYTALHLHSNILGRFRKIIIYYRSKSSMKTYINDIITVVEICNISFYKARIFICVADMSNKL